MELMGDNTGVSRENVLLEISIIRCCSLHLRSAASAQPSQQTQQQSSGKNTLQDTNQVSGQLVQAKNVNVNVTGDIFLAFIMVQTIVTQLSGAAREKKTLLS
jgi:hypothetical protein